MKTFVYKVAPGTMGEMHAQEMEFDKEHGTVLLTGEFGRILAVIFLLPGQWIAEKECWGPQISEIKQEPANAQVA